MKKLYRTYREKNRIDNIGRGDSGDELITQSVRDKILSCAYVYILILFSLRK